MATANFATTIVVHQTPEQVFNAINNVRGWWQGEIIGNTSQLNDEFSYQMNDAHYSKQRIIESIPNEKVVWLITDSKLKFTHESEWTDTKVIFEINQVKDKTQVCFRHVGLNPKFECYGNCSWAWGQLIEQSLYNLITTGQGTNVFG